MPDKYEQALRVLGLEPGATKEAVKDAYRDLAKVWHPDRFGSDPRLRTKAQAKLLELNTAFEQLRGYDGSEVRGAREPAPSTDRGTGSSVFRAPESSASRPTSVNTRNLVMLSSVAVLIGFLGTGLIIWRRASPQVSPARDTVQTPAAGRSAGAARQPSTRAADASSVRPTTGSLVIASRPLGARVSLDGRVVGETPITLTEVQPGRHDIDVAFDGNAYQPWSSPVIVTAGREEKLLAVMTPVEGGR